MLARANLAFHTIFINTLIVCTTLLIPTTLYAEQTSPQLRIAVAANFAPVLTQLLPKFTAQTGIKTQVISGATGALFQQIRHGAPFDVFLAADAIRPQLLAQQNLIIKDSLQTYAIGKLALFSATNALPNVESASTSFLDILTTMLKTNASSRLAIANPRTAPYGLAAKQSLQHLGLWQGYKNKLVIGININQTFQQARSQAVNFGIVAYSQLKLNKLKGVLLPENSYDAIKQQLVILKSSQNINQAKAFSQFLLSQSIQAKISEMGYKKVMIANIANKSANKPVRADVAMVSKQ
jgi:molybdate transport system substrate-binding protein